MADRVTTLTRLVRLLEDEVAAIRAGDLHGLALMPKGKAALVAELEAQTAGGPAGRGDMAALVALRRQAEVNQRMLGATLKGIRAGRNRLDGLRRAGRSLQSYDASGRPQTIGAPHSSLERRA